MTSISTQQPFTNPNYTYQHMQGCMLNALNKFAPELKLSHADCRIMTVLIGYWNKKQNKAYPTTRQLTNDCGMSSTTLTKGLKRLTDLGLIVIVKDSTTGRQNYFINQNKLFDASSSNIETEVVATVETPCSSTLDIKLTDHKLIEQTSLNKINNDDVSKIQSMTEYKNILNKLDSWNVINAKKIVQHHGIEKIKKIINVVKNKKPDNYGAYFRVLINAPNVINPNKNNACSLTSEMPLINQMVKHQYWQHIPSGKILKVLPDVGTHLLIKYFKQENMVTFIEENFTDKLENFNVIPWQ